jgi:hypothetical protein
MPRGADRSRLEELGLLSRELIIGEGATAVQLGELLDPLERIGRSGGRRDECAALQLLQDGGEAGSLR